MTTDSIAQLLREAAGEIRVFHGDRSAFADRLSAAAASLGAQEPVEYWVLYDATAEKKYIKKSAGDGSLAFFDTEAEAKRAQRRHGPGVEYKRIEYYRHPPTSAVPAGWKQLLDRVVPRLDAGGPNPIDEAEHCCEWTLYRERERIHAEFADIAAAPQQGGGEDE